MSDVIQRLFPELSPIFFYLVMAGLVFLETAAIFAFFIPGDTLLFTAGLIVAANSHLDIYLTVALICIAAFLGDQTAFAIGRTLGLSFIEKRESLRLSALLERAEKFYEKYGISTIALSRFYPWFRTLIPFLAGVGKMNYYKFLAVNSISAVVWGSLITFLGYFANSISALKNSSHQIALFFIALTVVLTLKNYLKNRKV